MAEDVGNTPGGAENGATSNDDPWGAAFAEEKKAKDEKQKQDNARPATFNQLRPETSSPVTNMDMILDIPVTVSVELGRARIMIKELLQLGQGAVVELEKLAGEPVEIFVNNRLVARGEAMVVNEKFGVKLTDIVSPSERINKLK
ncbi:MAG: flagellar motor switch protein FliN [Deltaproteobacteria bacterium]